MTRSTDTRLAVVDRWYAAYGERDIEALCEVSDPAIDIVPNGPLLSKLPGATFHGRDGVRTLARWSYENYPGLRLESSASRKVPGWILGSATFIVDVRSSPPVRRHTETLFDVSGGRIRRLRTFLSDSQALEAAAGEPVLTAREREIFQLLARGMTGPQIARHLVLSPATVRTHVQNGVVRLGANTRLHAVAIALKRGEIQL
jgi:DNA-binding CsgD family transcriptional regulator